MLILNAKIVTWEDDNRILDGYGVRIVDNLIREVAPTAELKDHFPADEVLDAGGQYLMPGNICAHTHFYGAYARGMAIPGAPAKDFPEILQKLWWPLDLSLNEEDVYVSAQVLIADAIRHGTTTLIDHHASPNAIEGSLDQIARAVTETGVRASLCYEVTDRNGMDGARAGIAENVRFYNKSVREPHPLLAASFGLHASLTLSDETLAACRHALPDGCGFHVHTAEHESDEYDSLAKSGTRVIDRLYRFGILGPRTIAVHAVHIDAREVQLLAESGTWVTHQPRSNMNNGVGIGPVESYLRAGIRVCLGNDGFSNAMWEEWKTAYLVHKLWNRDPRRMGGYDVTRMAVYNNAALANMFFPAAPIGVIVPGAQADLILVDYHPFTECTAGNLPWHIIFGFHESMITATMVNGKWLMKDRKLLTIDEEAVAARGRELSAVAWKRYEAQFTS
jgi:putative selenium metabolism protein SsnA